MIARCAAWLRPGGLLLISHGGTEGEISGEMFGVDFHYSADAPEEFLACIEESGFRIIHHEMDEPPVIEAGGYGHCATLATAF